VFVLIVIAPPSFSFAGYLAYSRRQPSRLVDRHSLGMTEAFHCLDFQVRMALQLQFRAVISCRISERLAGTENGGVPAVNQSQILA
jgi:hypothetical protein